MMDIGFSIVICTYQPDTNLFSRLLKAVRSLERGELPVEVIIVDNNSPLPVTDQKGIEDIQTAFTEFRVIVEKKPGLTNARISGIKQTKYNWIIFFDDDNEPSSGYLVNAAKLIGAYPQSGCWGPGKINVEFLGKVSGFVLEHKALFQERNMTETKIDNVRWGQDAYPYGTGMVVKKVILNEYVRQVENGNYTMSDRIGKSLISGGDIQILLTGIKMGYYAGSSPSLELNHLIKLEKTKFKKMLQLVFMLSASAAKTYNQVFPEDPHTIMKFSNKDVLKVCYFHIRTRLFKTSFKTFLYDLTKRMGELEAHILAGPGKTPGLLKLYWKFIS